MYVISKKICRETKQWIVWNSIVWNTQFIIGELTPKQMSRIWCFPVCQLGLKVLEFCLLFSTFHHLDKTVVHWHYTELSAILVKKNEDKKTLIPLREIFRIDIMKCLFKNKNSQGLPNKKCKHKETACSITSTKKVK